MSDLADAAVRRRIGPWVEEGLPDLDEFEARTSFVVRAAAGSGKTTSLVARMTALVRQGVSVDEIAAITFTRKAAGEMKERFHEELEETREVLEQRLTAADGSSREALRRQLERVERAREHLGRTFIGTIHAFCARLLRERPLEAGVPPDFTAGVEERRERELRLRSWQRYLARIASEEPRRLDRLEELGVDPQDLFDFFSDLAHYEELEVYTDGPDEPPDLDAELARAEEVLADWADRFPEAPVEDADPDATMRAFERARSMRSHTELERPAQKAAFLEVFHDLVSDEKAKLKVTRWAERGTDAYEEAKRLRDEVLPELAESIEPALRAWSAYLHGELVAFVRPAVEAYAERRRREGLLTFHDLLLVARDLLREHPQVRSYFQERYRYLLVDEFQDTDPVQAEVLFFLTSRDLHEQRWDRCRPRSGSLFIVGDDKQSIYRFRRADLDVFEKVASLVSEAGGEEVELTTNFRSVEAICDWCDEAFGGLFEEAEDRRYQASYTPFTPNRRGTDSDRHLRQLVTEKVPRNGADAIARAEAGRIADAVAALVEEGPEAGDGMRGPRPAEWVDEEPPGLGDVLILTRTKSRLSIYAEALAERNLPYTLTGGGDLGDSEELRALTDLLALVERADDPVAKVAYLRGRLVGLSDGDLYQYRRAGGDFGEVAPSLDEDLRRRLTEEGSGLEDRLSEAFVHLDRSRNLLDRLAPTAAIARLMDELGLFAAAAHTGVERRSGSLAAGRLVRVLSYVRRLEIDGLHWTEIREELDRILDGELDPDGMTLETGTGEAVRLMNVHQAKGLEAKVVFLADPYNPHYSPSPDRHVQRDEGRIVIPATQTFGEHRSTELAAPRAWHERFEEEEIRYQEAEERRLQYVAATRAKDLLVVSRYRPKDENGFWAELYPYLDRAAVPELELEQRPKAGRRTAPAPDLEPVRRRREAARDRVSAAGYSVETVTGSGGADRSKVSPAHRGYGTEFGTALHHLFARLARGEEVADERLTELLEAYDLTRPTTDQVEAARRMIASFRSSDLAGRLDRADAVRTELPLAGWRAQDERNTEHGGAGATLRRGVIDLVYRLDEAWHLVDHKTDRAADEHEAERLADHYRPQIEQYAEIWASVTDRALASASLWLADLGSEIRILNRPAAEADSAY